MRQNPCLWLIIVFPYYTTCNRNIFHHQTSGSNISSVEETCLMCWDSQFFPALTKTEFHLTMASLQSQS